MHRLGAVIAVSSAIVAVAQARIAKTRPRKGGRPEVAQGSPVGRPTPNPDTGQACSTGRAVFVASQL